MPLETQNLFERIAKALRTDSVEEISSKIGLSKQAVYLWQKGKPPSLETLVFISDLSGASLHYLVTGEGNMYVDGAQGRQKLIGLSQIYGGVKLGSLDEIESNGIDFDELSKFVAKLEKEGGVTGKFLKKLISREFARLMLLAVDIETSRNITDIEPVQQELVEDIGALGGEVQTTSRKKRKA